MLKKAPGKKKKHIIRNDLFIDNQNYWLFTNNYYLMSSVDTRSTYAKQLYLNITTEKWKMIFSNSTSLLWSTRKHVSWQKSNERHVRRLHWNYETSREIKDQNKWKKLSHLIIWRFIIMKLRILHQIFLKSQCNIITVWISAGLVQSGEVRRYSKGDR